MKLTTGETLLYSGHTVERAHHTEDVGLTLSLEAQRTRIGWEPVNFRIITAKFNTKKIKIKLNIIQCYAPTMTPMTKRKTPFTSNYRQSWIKQRRKIWKYSLANFMQILELTTLATI